MEKYRAEMLEITKSILDQILERQRLAETIAEVKAASGFTVENHKIEEKLNSEMLRYARDSGLDNELAGKIVAELLDYSKIAQRKKIHLPAIREYLRSSRIEWVSIFGAGRMGGWFARYFAKAGAKVLIFDKNNETGRKRAKEMNCEFTNNFRRAAKSDLLVVAVPITATPTILRELEKVLSSDTSRRIRIIEISSVKSGIPKLSSRISRNVRLYSIHPLFGPTGRFFAENSMILIGGGSSIVPNMFPHYRFFRMSAKEHDRLMATMLTVPHLHALSFADTVLERKIPAEIHSPSFDYLLGLAKRVLKESELVYYEIQGSNPFAGKALNETLTSMLKLQKLFKDKTAFKKFFDKTRQRLS